MEEETAESGVGVEPSNLPNLSDAIEKLMAHPEILSMAASVLGQNIQASEAKREESDADAEDGRDESIPVGKAHGDDARGHKDMTDALPDLMGLLGPMLSGGKGEKKAHHGKGIGRSTALLLALKPFLSPSRCEAVDKLVQLGKIGEVFEKLS